MTTTRFDGSRLGPVLDELGIKYGRDDDGDVFADWEDMRMWFLAAGQDHEILAMRAIWDHRAPADHYDSLVSHANDWNSAKMWPRMSVALRDDRVVAGADLIVDLETGATDAFLRQQVRCMIGTCLDLLEFLAEAYPHHREWSAS